MIRLGHGRKGPGSGRFGTTVFCCSNVCRLVNGRETEQLNAHGALQSFWQAQSHETRIIVETPVQFGSPAPKGRFGGSGRRRLRVKSINRTDMLPLPPEHVPAGIANRTVFEVELGGVGGVAFANGILQRSM